MTDVTINGTNGDDIIVVTATGTDSGTYSINGGTAATATYTAGATPDSGVLEYAGAAGTQTIQFAGIAPIVDTVAAASLTINGTAGADTITVSDGGLANGFQSTTDQIIRPLVCRFAATAGPQQPYCA